MHSALILWFGIVLAILKLPKICPMWDQERQNNKRALLFLLRLYPQGAFSFDCLQLSEQELTQSGGVCKLTLVLSTPDFGNLSNKDHYLCDKCTLWATFDHTSVVFTVVRVFTNVSYRIHSQIVNVTIDACTCVKIPSVLQVMPAISGNNRNQCYVLYS